MSADLDLVGVPATLRAIILGHQIAGSVEGSAAVTHITYTLRHPHVRRVVQAADQLNDYFIEHATPPGDMRKPTDRKPTRGHR